MKPKFSADEGIVYPAAYRVFYGLRYISFLALIQLLAKRFNKKWGQSHCFVDAYVLFWLFIIGIGSVIVLHVLCDLDGTCIYPTALRISILVLLVCRLIDILQSWWRVLFIPPFKAKVPRIVILVLMNYLEIVIAFGVIGFLLQLQPYYNPLAGEIQILDGLRASAGILTPLGVPSIPQTWTTGVLFYLEYATGLFFLVVIINVVLSYLTNQRK